MVSGLLHGVRSLITPRLPHAAILLGKLRAPAILLMAIRYCDNTHDSAWLSYRCEPLIHATYLDIYRPCAKRLPMIQHRVMFGSLSQSKHSSVTVCYKRF